MNFFHCIKKGYGNLKLRNKMTFIVILAVAIPFITLFSLFARSLLDMITSSTIRRQQEAAAQVSPSINQVISDIISVSEKIQELPFYQDTFSNVVTLDPSIALSSTSASDFQKEALQCLEGTYVTDLRFYLDLPPTSYCFSDQVGELFKPISSIQSSYWYGIFYSSHPSSLFCPPFYLSDSEKNSLNNLAYIIPVSVSKPNGDYVRGYMACYFSSDTLKKYLTPALQDTEGIAYITNERDSIVVSTDPGLAGLYYTSYSTIQKSMESSNGFLEKTVLNQKVYIGYYSISNTNTQWVLVTVLPSRPLEQRANRTIWTFLLVSLLSIIVGVMISLSLSRSLSQRITAVADQMNQVKTGPPVPMPSPEETDEIGNLVDSYNYMAGKINSLIEDEKKASEELRRAEFRALQAQINPHFLYNTMDMINWMAQQGRSREINQATRDLSRFYRLTLGQKDPLCSIADEIEHVTIYIRLQNMRFDDGIAFVVDVPDAMLEYRIPRLTLQPIIENAILHGILEKASRRGTIVITGWLEESSIILLVSDDGVGIPEDKLGKILTSQMGTGSGSHIAVFNTHRRLQILFGENYGLAYSSRLGEGTDVEIRIPVMKQKPE